MAQQPIAHEVTIWTDPTRAALTSQVLKLMGPVVQPIGVGGPRGAEVDDLAQTLNCPRQDDLRKLLVDHPAEFVLLISHSNLRYQDIDAAVNEGSTVLALEPVAADYDELSASKLLVARGQVVTIPAFTSSPGWMSAADPGDILGQPQVISYTSFGKTGDCSLFARLCDAFVLLQRFAPLPESIDASLVSPLPTIPQQLRAMTGHLMAHIRFSGDRSGVLQISDQAALRARSLHVIGDQAELHVGDLDYDLREPNGKVIDHFKAEEAVSSSFADLITWQWQQHLSRGNGGGEHSNTHAVACCVACLLSCRTGESESPVKLLSVHRQH